MGYLTQRGRQVADTAREGRAPTVAEVFGLGDPEPGSPDGYSSAELHRLVRLWHARAALAPEQAERIIALLKRASPIGAESEYEHWQQMIADQDARIAARKDTHK